MIPLHDENRPHDAPWVTRTLVVLCIGAFAWQLSVPDDAIAALTYRLGLVPAFLTGAVQPHAGLHALWPPLTLLTSAFLHGDVMHILGNLLYLWVFGDNVEDAMGHRRFIAFYVLCAAAAGLAQTLADPASTVPMIGASGAISGVLGAYLLIFPRTRVVLGIPVVFMLVPVRLPAIVVIGLWAGIQLTNAFGTDGGNVAWFAHLGGFAAGLALAPLLKSSRHPLFGPVRDHAAGPLARKAALRIVRPEPARSGPAGPVPDADARSRRRGPWG